MNRTTPLPRLDGISHHDIHANGVRLHVAESGTGAPVLFLHGFPQHWYAWRRVTALLPDCRLICPDLRGAGWSDAPRTGYSVTALAHDVIALIDAMGLDQVVLVGHDWGAKVGFRLCAIAPDRFSGFVALNTLHPWLGRAPLALHAWRQWHTALIEYPVIGAWVLRRTGIVPYLLRRWVGTTMRWSDEDLAGYAERFTSAERARAGQALHWQFVRHEIPRMLRGAERRPTLTVPTTLLFGRADPTLSPDRLTVAERHVAQLRVELIDGAGHHLPEERPELVAAAVRAMLVNPAIPAGN